MKIFVSFVFLCFCQSSWSVCSFKSPLKKVISLSGPMTILLREIGLLNDPALQGISVFNPIADKDFKKTRYPGGVFLSRTTLNEFHHSVVFYDEGRELNKILSSAKDIQSFEIKTRHKLPMEVVDSLVEILKPFITGCNDELGAFKTNALNMQKEILEKLPDSFKVIFYLGRFVNDRPPELVIVNDGVVKKLVSEKKIVTYPSDLSYVNWSSKIMSGLGQDFIHLGIEDSGRKHIKEIRRSSKQMTLVYPGALVPGYSQLEAFLFWANSL